MPQEATHVTPPASARTFLALRPSAAARVALREIRAVLARRLRDGGCRARIGWVPEDRLHLTLLFLGERSAEERDVVTRAADAAAGASRPFDWGVGAPGAFPSAARPRVLWAGVTPGAPEVVALRARLLERLDDRGVPVDAGETFVPHVTLGRVRGRGPLRRADPDWFGPLPDRAPATTRATRLETFVSEPGPDGPAYRVVGAATLGGPERGRATRS